MGLERSLLLALSLVGCIQTDYSRCPTSGRICGQGLRCVDETDSCISATGCGDLSVGANEECDDGNSLSHDGCSSTCLIESPVWTRINTTGRPTENFALAYDAYRGQVVAFGGESSGSFPDDSTRVWTGMAWGYPTPKPSPSPPPRVYSAMAYDPDLGKVILFGGAGTAGALDDTWAWDGAAWAKIDPPPTMNPPLPLQDPAFSSLEGTGHPVMFGGTEPTMGTETSNTWIWVRGWWFLNDPLGAMLRPAARSLSALAPYSRGALLFGGTAGADTWFWDGSAWMKLHPAISPPTRSAHAMAYESHRRVVLYGGTDELGTTCLDDTWLWDGSTWMKLTPQGEQLPPKLCHHEMIYDAVHRYALMVGGRDDTANSSAVTWGFRFERPGAPEESCIAAEDTDMDGFVGCADLDCWGLCSPHCPPGIPCPDTAPRCGDGDCNELLEKMVCPEDCP